MRLKSSGNVSGLSMVVNGEFRGEEWEHYEAGIIGVRRVSGLWIHGVPA